MATQHNTRRYRSKRRPTQNGSIWPTRDTSTGPANAHEVLHEMWQLSSFLGAVSYDDIPFCDKHFVIFMAFNDYKIRSLEKLYVSH